MESALLSLLNNLPLLSIVLLAVIKDKLFNLIDGILFRFDKDFNEGDPIILKGKNARITKIGLFKTKVYMLDKHGKAITMRKFNNYDVDRLEMEKLLANHEE